jgi:predicted DNA-binding ribbon-helix-helix protein
MPSKLGPLGVSYEIFGRQALDRGRAFWNGLKEIVRERHMTLSELVAEIDAQRQLGNLSSALRLFVLEFYRTQPCHGKEGHDGTHEMIGYTAPAFS